MKRSVFWIGLLGVMILAEVSPVHAGPPFNTEDVGVNPVGKFQFSAVADVWKKKFQPGVELRHGITEAMDFGIGAGYAIMPKDEKGSGSFELTPKFMLIPDIFAVITSISVADPEYEGYLILGHAFGPIAINANLGWIAEAGAHHVDIPYLMSVSYQHERFEIGPEIGVNIDHDGFKFNMWNVASRVYPVPWLAWVTAVGGDFGFSKGPYHGLNVQLGIDMVFPYDEKAATESAPDRTAVQTTVTPTGTTTPIHNQPVQTSNTTAVQSPVILNATESPKGSVPPVQNEPVPPPVEPSVSAPPTSGR